MKVWTLAIKDKVGLRAVAFDDLDALVDYVVRRFHDGPDPRGEIRDVQDWLTKVGVATGAELRLNSTALDIPVQS